MSPPQQTRQARKNMSASEPSATASGDPNVPTTSQALVLAPSATQDAPVSSATSKKRSQGKEDEKTKPKRRKKNKIQEILSSSDSIEFQAEYLLMEYGNKVISKLLEEGYMSTVLFKELSRLARAKGYDLNMRKVANDYISHLPILRVLRDIGMNMSYEDDFLLRLAIKWRYVSTVQFLLKNGADPAAMGGQPLLDAYMPSAHSKEPDMHLFSILLNARKDFGDFPEKLLNRLVKDKNYATWDTILSKTVATSTTQVGSIFKRMTEQSDPDWHIIRSFIVHQPEFIMSLRDVLSSKSIFFKNPEVFGLLLEYDIKLEPSDQMKKHIEPYCQRMLDESTPSTLE